MPQSTQEAHSSGKRAGEVVRQMWPELMRDTSAIRGDVKLDAAGHKLVQDPWTSSSQQVALA